MLAKSITYPKVNGMVTFGFEEITARSELGWWDLRQVYSSIRCVTSYRDSEEDFVT